MTDTTALSSLVREQRVIACLNLDGMAAMQLCASSGLTAEDFTDRVCREIFLAAEALQAANSLFDGGEILWEASQHRGIKTDEFLAATQQRPALVTVELPALCRQLKALTQKRRMRTQAAVVSEALMADDQEKISSALSALQTASLDTIPRVNWRQIAEMEIAKSNDIIAGRADPDFRCIRWPWRDFDFNLKPMRRGELVIIAGYTSLGKSSFQRQLCLAAAKEQLNVAMVSMEMPAGDLFNLMASSLSGQPWSRLKSLHPSDQSEFISKCREVGALGIEVLDDAHSLSEITGWLKNQHSRRFLDVVAIDYLGLVSECASGRPGVTKAQAVGEVACAFKRLATELDCVVLLAVQVNRSSVGDSNREPRLFDLKDSGDIEAHADRVILLHRPNSDPVSKCDQSGNEPITDRPRWFMQISQEKGRNAGTFKTGMWFRRELARFELIHA